MLAAILAAFKAIPLLVDSINGLIAAFNKYQDAQWRNELNEISSKLNGPATIEDKQAAAKKLADLISRL